MSEKLTVPKISSETVRRAIEDSRRRISNKDDHQIKVEDKEKKKTMNPELLLTKSAMNVKILLTTDAVNTMTEKERQKVFQTLGIEAPKTEKEQKKALFDIMEGDDGDVIINREKMIKWIKQYMSFAKTSEEFDGTKGHIWVSAEHGDEYEGNEIYNYERYGSETHYLWAAALDRRGWGSEWEDGGTVMIYSNYFER